MSVEVQKGADVRVVTCRISGKLTRDDYQELTPKIESVIRKHGKARLLVEMQDFHGLDAGAFWEDVKFDARHYNDIERCAFIGEKKWQEWMVQLCRPFTSAKIRYFEPKQSAEAVDWLMRD
jgi:hypothetical protein